MNRVHSVYTIITFGQAGIKSYLPPGQVQNLGASCSKIKLAPWASAEEILMSTPVYQICVKTGWLVGCFGV